MMNNCLAKNPRHIDFDRSESDIFDFIVIKTNDVLKQYTFEVEALRHRDVLYRAALRMTKNKSDAEDLLQETFEKAYRSWGKYKLGSNCRAWLFKIIINMFYNRCRSKLRMPILVNLEKIENDYTIDPLVSFGKQDTPERQLFNKILGCDIKKAIEELPDEFKHIMKLMLLEGLSYQKIADITNLQLGTVKSRLYRGRLLLRKKLNGYVRKNNQVKSYMT